jgi:hypothetical protein
MIRANVSPIPSQCGGIIIHSFNNYSDWSLKGLKKAYGGRMLIATFNQIQEKAYEDCCKTFTWLGQSKPILNPNSGNMIFTVIFKA